MNRNLKLRIFDFIRSNSTTLVTGGLALFACAAHASSFNDDVKTLLQSRFAAAVILTDSEALELGFGSFDPNQVLDTDFDQIGSEGATQERKNKSSYVLPYSHQFDAARDGDAHVINFKAFYLTAKSDVALIDPQAPKDQLKEKSYGASIGYGYRYQVNPQFSITPSLNTHLIYYKNDFNAASSASELGEELLSGLVINTSAWSNLYEPSLLFDYRLPRAWGKWHLSSKWNYFYGHAWGDANGGNIGNPNGWYITNQASMFYDVFDRSQTLFLGAKRVDLANILETELGARHYYEASVGWLVNKSLGIEAIDNIGLGLNFNYGSSLKGGSIVFYYNKF